MVIDTNTSNSTYSSTNVDTISKKEYNNDSVDTCDDEKITNEEILNIIKPLINKFDNTENKDDIKIIVLDSEKMTKITLDNFIKNIELTKNTKITDKNTDMQPNYKMYVNAIKKNNDIDTYSIDSNNNNENTEYTEYNDTKNEITSDGESTHTVASSCTNSTSGTLTNQRIKTDTTIKVTSSKKRACRKVPIKFTAIVKNSQKKILNAQMNGTVTFTFIKRDKIIKRKVVCLDKLNKAKVILMFKNKGCYKVKATYNGDCDFNVSHDRICQSIKSCY